MYERLGRSLGGDFDLSASVQELRLNNWIAPIYARLQRRFVRFVSSNVEEKLEEIFDASYETMLDKVIIDIDPKYTLPSASVDTTIKAKTTDQYPAWDLAEYIVKIIRNSISSIDAPSIDAKISNKFQSNLSKNMRRLAKAVEKLSDRNFAQLDAKEVALVDMTGLSKAEVSIIPKQSVLQSLGMTEQDLSILLQENNIDLGNFVVRDGQYQYNIRFSSTLKTIQDIENIYLDFKR